MLQEPRARSFAVLLLAVASAVAAQAPDLTLKVDQLAEGIYLFRAPSDLDRWTATNVVAIINQDDVTVFDSNTRPLTARMVIAEIRRLTAKPVRTLINSHWHMDHWSGNDEYVNAFPGLQIIATLETREYMRRMGSGFFADSLHAGAARARTALDEAIQTGKKSDGTPLTDEERRQQERDVADRAAFAAEVAAIRRVLPNVGFQGSLTFWSGGREFRLFAATGDATDSAALYLPAEKILVCGDVLVHPESGDGPPPWTTNSYAITPWLESLRAFDTLDANIIVPGQGPAFHDKAYLRLTIELYSAILEQVHAALERGLFKLDDVQAVVNVDAIGVRYTPGATAPGEAFQRLKTTLVRKAYQESLDGVMR
ncbi:MAG TPA: MBL fold metallo-hydrolase [Kofleriaceae bacterium]|jgi:glyoxylase-like metal-dependent hydrolase (beta-lactamase superfamily II)